MHTNQSAIATERTARNGRAFTLLELLVVVTIIVVVIALLVPALDRAMHESQKVQCLANLKGVGTAVASYVSEKKQYPTSPGYGRLFGKRGINNVVGAYGDWDSDGRPLNEYMGFTGPGANVKIAQCPSDQGDSIAGREAITNCYEYYGNSYHEPLTNAYGMGTLFNGQPAVNVSPTHNKIVFGDYGLYGDRLIRNERTRWHQLEYRPGAEPAEQVRQLNVLFADGRAEFLTFDNALLDDQADPNNRTRPVNRNSAWW